MRRQPVRAVGFRLWQCGRDVYAAIRTLQIDLLSGLLVPIEHDLVNAPVGLRFAHELAHDDRPGVGLSLT